jgi:hypothetical protein
MHVNGQAKEMLEILGNAERIKTSLLAVTVLSSANWG